MTSTDKQPTKHWTVSSEFDFQNVMEALDNELRQEEVPVGARPIQGWFRISRRFGLGLTMFPQKKSPTPGVYVGDDLALRIFEWFDRRYGDRLCMDFDLGQTVIVLRNDAHRAILPRIYGKVQLVCDPTHYQEKFYPTVTKGHDMATLNLLDLIQGATKTFICSLAPIELSVVCQELRTAIAQFFSIETMAQDNLATQARGDLRSSVDCMLMSPPQHGMSRWHSLQASEKFLKALLAANNASYPRSGGKGHDLHLLAGLAAGSGLPPISKDVLERASCTSNVRYGESKSNLQQAVMGHRAAVQICSIVSANRLAAKNK